MNFHRLTLFRALNPAIKIQKSSSLKKEQVLLSIPAPKKKV